MEWFFGQLLKWRVVNEETGVWIISRCRKGCWIHHSCLQFSWMMMNLAKKTPRKITKTSKTSDWKPAMVFVCQQLEQKSHNCIIYPSGKGNLWNHLTIFPVAHLKSCISSICHHSFQGSPGPWVAASEYGTPFFRSENTGISGIPKRWLRHI